MSIYSGSRKYAYSQFYNRIIQFTKVMSLSRHLLGNLHVMYSVEETSTRPQSKAILDRTRILGTLSMFHASFLYLDFRSRQG